MSFLEDFKNSIFRINEESFEDSSLTAFDYQYHNCYIYRLYCDQLKRTPKTVKSLIEIPFLPIEFFKNHAIKTGNWNEERVFKSSGTTSTVRSKHYVRDSSYYHTVARKTFEKKFGRLSDFLVIAILPSYLAQGDSSLISMVEDFISHAAEGSGFFLEKEVAELLNSDDKKLVIGVSYALLDLTEIELEVRNTLLIETGGMKGRKKEMTREELHSYLQNGFNVEKVWSEYGMTELFSQAYGLNGKFEFPSWAKCFIRDINDPFSFLPKRKTGGINIIDLTNIDSCCFIETKDLGRYENDYFEVLGRFDNSDIRGCNLLI